MAGYDLKEGYFDNTEISEEQFWDAIANVFTECSLNSSSYKYGFLKSILDNLTNADSSLMLSFDCLFTTFTEIYWPLIMKFNLRQNAAMIDNRKTFIEKIFLEAKEVYGLAEYTPYESLSLQVRSNIIHKVKKHCKTYVVGALFEDTRRKFYSFSKKEGWIQINPRVYNYVIKRKNELLELNTYEWAHYLSKVNGEYSINQILVNCFSMEDISQVNTLELLFESETLSEIASIDSTINNHEKAISRTLGSDSEMDYQEIDYEALELLDDPVALINLLMKKRAV